MSVQELSILRLSIVACIFLTLESTSAPYGILAIQGDVDNIVTLARALGATTFVSYLTTTGLNTTLAGQGPFTVFVPTNDAFENLSDDMKDNFNDTEFARTTLKYHITSGRHYKSEFQDEEILISQDKDLPIRINLYKGGTVLTASGCAVSLTDINATNGVLHLVDRVMVMTPEFGSVSGLLSFPIFRFMYYGMIDGNMTGLLSGHAPITVFAPNDAAFQKLPPDQFKKLYKNGTAIRRMMRNHIVRGTFFTAGMYNGEPLNTMEGQTLNVAMTNGNVTVNDAPLVIPDWTCSNGVAHVTATVFMPPGLLESLTDDDVR
ncbi:transforming growth factor-beta-induced protein ig-h3-like [Mizuhopecten yessoensis]|uniref:Transforming growth factor-beta-induced protein ig-h3 n=1 Tax=Mizuhopecten yessoensis TaxID=6573 RepID=A0A210PF66_MIZYE|nr:transforming growth factor-beta-induced protein ig-h3-like [Mizuhopecten yessoensis]OWF35135.1 Transforming growth factor-beta-induced protein ig-h3 [Mizuhopecten yessoensis]